VKLKIKINAEDKNNILMAGQFNHSVYYKLDYLINGKLVAQSSELLYKYLIAFHAALSSMKCSQSAYLNSIGGVVDIGIVKTSQEDLRVTISCEQYTNKKSTKKTFEVSLTYRELEETYSQLLQEIKKIASKIKSNLNLDKLPN